MKTLVRKKFSWVNSKAYKIIKVEYCDDTGMFFVNYEDSKCFRYSSAGSCYGNFIEARDVFLRACKLSIALGAEIIEEITEASKEV